MIHNRLLNWLRISSLYLLGFMLGGSTLAWAEASSYRVAPGDTIRSILLHTACVTSMEEYGDLRAEFARLNPQIFHSGMLVAGQEIFVPQKKRQGPCLQLSLGQVVRVEVELGTTWEKVRIYLDGPILPDLFLLKNQSPHRLVCDFDITLPADELVREIMAPGRLVRSLRIGHETTPFQRTRVVLDLEEILVGGVEQVFFEEESLFEIILHERF